MCPLALLSQHTQRKIKLNYLDGTCKNVDLNQNFRDVYKDEYTTEQLPREQTKEAIHDELAYFCEHVFRGISYEEVANDPRGKSSEADGSTATRVIKRTLMSVADLWLRKLTLVPVVVTISMPPHPLSRPSAEEGEAWKATKVVFRGHPKGIL